MRLNQLLAVMLQFQQGNCDDSIAGIDAMIPRLLKMKKQLIAQKSIEVALKDANDSEILTRQRQ